MASDTKDGLLSSDIFKHLVFNAYAVDRMTISQTGIYDYNLTDPSTALDKGAPTDWAWGTLAVFGGTWGIIQMATSNKTGDNHVYIRKGTTGAWTTLV